MGRGEGLAEEKNCVWDWREVSGQVYIINFVGIILSVEVIFADEIVAQVGLCITGLIHSR